jgi:alginate O-acetyltransferase complex protein AlgI
MLFNTSWFLIFFLITYVLFLAVPKGQVRFGFILLASAVFHYHFAGPAGVRPIIVIALCTFGFGLWLARLEPGSRARRLVFVAAVTVPTVALIAYKYRGLLFSSVPFLWKAPAPARLGAAQVALPLAISFFTFEFVHYLTDVYHGGQPIRNPFKFAFFCIFFPSIVSGPIKRYQPFLGQLEEGIGRLRGAVAIRGAGQVLVGFFKKLVVADNAALAIELLEKKPVPSRAGVALLLFLLSVRILFDFSGYSDIAIGLGRMLGLELPQNFRYPYIARNISDFWQRWHISLSRWIRDYIYIPLGGGHRGIPVKIANLSLTMFLCGLWHGAAWHFGLWGLYHGFGLATHSVWEKSPLGRRFAALPASRWVGMLVTDAFVAYGWLLFFYPMDKVVVLTKSLLGLQGAS